jgi:hypothetical protein
MRNLFLFFLIISLSTVNAQTPKDYSCNEHVKYNVEAEDGYYNITFTFKDQKEVLRTFKFSYNIKNTVRDIARYGVPASFFENISSTVPMTKTRKKAIKRGLYMQTDKFLKPDRSAIVSFYRPYCKAIALGIITTLINEGTDNRLNRIEMAMKFVQDIPYGIPEIKDSTWEVYGIFPPPEIMIRMFGDCDSKAIMFASILTYLINDKDILFLFQGHDHALVAIKGTPSLKQKYIELDKAKYIICDVTGPERLAMGDDGNKFDAAVGYKVEKVKVKGFWFHSI